MYKIIEKFCEQLPDSLKVQRYNLKNRSNYEFLVNSIYTLRKPKQACGKSEIISKNKFLSNLKEIIFESRVRMYKLKSPIIKVHSLK